MKHITKDTILAILILTTFSFYCVDVNLTDTPIEIDNTNFSAKESFSYEFAVDKQEEFFIDAVNGTINIIGYENISDAKIWGERIVKSESESDAAAHLENLKVTVNNTIDNIYIQTKQPNESNGREYLVNYNLSVPKNWDVSINLVNGVVTIDSLNGDINLSLVNGDINLTAINGNSDVNITNGEVYSIMSLPENGVCEITAVNATIELQIPKTTSANFAAGVLNGIVAAEVFR